MTAPERGSGWTVRRLLDPAATPYYAVALMLGFLLNAWSYAQVHPLAVLRTFVLATFLVALLTIVLSAALRNAAAGGFLAALVVAGLVGWGRFSAYLATYMRQGIVLKVVGALLVFAAVALGAWLLWRWVSRPGGWARLTQALNVLGAVFLAVTLFGAARSGVLGFAWSDLTTRPSVSEPPAGSADPDIWVIMPDEYGRADILESVYGIDMAAFLDGLRQRGFEVAQGNSSNYPATPYNLMSMFHMRHVPDIESMAPMLNGDIDLQAGMRNGVNHNETFDFLRSRGYEIVTVAPPWEDVALRSADVYVDNGGINEFEVSLVERTALDRVARTLAPDALFQQERDRVSFALTQMDAISADRADGPRFVFVHVVVPHMPAVFGADGEAVRMPYEQFFWVDSAPQRGMDREEYRRLALGQVQYISTAVVPALDRLIDNDPDAVVVLFGDHGSGVGMDWEDVPDSDLAERFSNLFAARTPGRDDVFDVDASLINTMPALFDGYFGMSLPRQPDTHYAWRDGKETDLYVWEGALP